MPANANKPSNQPRANKKKDQKHALHLELPGDLLARAEKGEPVGEELIQHLHRWYAKRFSLPEVGEITGLRWETIQAWIDRKHIKVGEFKHTRNKRLFNGFNVMEVRIVGDMSRIGVPPRIWRFVSEKILGLAIFRTIDPTRWQGLRIALYRKGKEWEIKEFSDTHPDEDRSYLPATVLLFDIDRMMYECRDRIDEILQRQDSIDGGAEYRVPMNTEAGNG